MARQFDVVGDELEGDELDGEVMGEVMGDDEVVGIVRRNPRTGRQQIFPVAAGRGGGRRLMPIPSKPQWRQQLAPGVIQPDEGMYPLPMTPSANAGTFAAAFNQITFEGQLQKPYRAERLLVSTVRTIAGGAPGPRLLGVLYVGTDLQQAEITAWDIELIGQANSFGTRLTCKSAEPGVKIRLVVTPSAALTGTDTIFCSVTFLGRVIA